MTRRGFEFNRGALVSVPLLLLFVLGVIFHDRLPVPAGVLIGAWLVLGVISVWMALVREGGRTEALQRVARELGLSFSKDGDDTSLRAFMDDAALATAKAELEVLLQSLGPAPPGGAEALAAAMGKVETSRGLAQTVLRRLSLFTGNTNDAARNVLFGMVGGASAAVFDHSYSTRRDPSLESGQTFTVSQTVAAFRFPGLALPPFEISPEGIRQRIFGALGRQDINFPSHPEFSRRFRLRGDDEAAVRHFFSPSVLRACETLPPSHDLVIEGAGDCLVVYQPGRKVAHADLVGLVHEANVIAMLLGAPGTAAGAPQRDL